MLAHEPDDTPDRTPDALPSVGEHGTPHGSGPQPTAAWPARRASNHEFLCSQAKHGLGIPTTRALGLTGSPLHVRREAVETAAVVARVAPCFFRLGLGLGLALDCGPFQYLDGFNPRPICKHTDTPGCIARPVQKPRCLHRLNKSKFIAHY